eukprot:Tbor_TRINITY_DN6132_c0_g1::TRINITY_DN6132_c0_g1_i1::g.22716::m.22716
MDCRFMRRPRHNDQPPPRPQSSHSVKRSSSKVYLILLTSGLIFASLFRLLVFNEEEIGGPSMYIDSKKVPGPSGPSMYKRENEHININTTANSSKLSPPNVKLDKLVIFPSFDYDKNITELAGPEQEDPQRDGTLFHVRTSISSNGSTDDSGRENIETWNGAKEARAAIEGKPFITSYSWKGKCWYEVENFCVLNGVLTFFHDPTTPGGNRSSSHSLRMCNEFSQHSPSIQLKYTTVPMPEVLPAPLYTKTPGWVLQFWCQDLFHMTLSMLPAFHTKKNFKNVNSIDGNISDSNSSSSSSTGVSDRTRIWGAALPRVQGEHGINPDIHIRIARGIRKNKAYCHMKLGDPRNWEDVRNKKWNDHQFPIAGNPYWPFYQILTERPDRVYPLYKGSVTSKRACYTHGIIDKKYIKDSTGLEARQYSNALLNALKVPHYSTANQHNQLNNNNHNNDVGQLSEIPLKVSEMDSNPVIGSNITSGIINNNINFGRRCGHYRMTLIDRRGRTRRLSNIPEIVALGEKKGFEVKSVVFENLPIRKQLQIITRTDLLIGVHGNGLMWLQFLPPGSAVVELVGVWYTPYALLWGHRHFYSKIYNNKPYKDRGEKHPFSHNLTEIGALLDEVKVYLYNTSCRRNENGVEENLVFVPPNERLGDLYKSCLPHC